MEGISMQMPAWMRGDTPWQISFRVSNSNYRHDLKFSVLDEEGNETWHKGNVYWGYLITTTGSSYKRKICNGKYKSSSYSYTSTWDSDGRRWEDSYIDIWSCGITISYDGKGVITVLENDLIEKTFYGAKLSSITMLAGPAADLRVTGFSVKRATLYHTVKEYIEAGDRKYKSEDYWDAAMEYSKAIDGGYKNYDVYYSRATAYCSAEFYNNAIDDYTNALYYKETEDAYLFRGLAKLKKNDISGVEDLKKGGTRGLALVREMELDGGSGIGTSRDGSSKYLASGTGFFVDPRGFIATNYHVIDGAKGIDVFVTKNGKTSTYRAECVVSDKQNDLAVIKINDGRFSTMGPVPYTLGHGTKDVGTTVFTMGYPELSYLGDEIKVTNGIVNSKTGYQGDITTYQISAPIQHGNSGGPLFDGNGQIIGVTNAGVMGLQNVGYAIKVSYLDNLIEASPQKIYLPTVNQLSGLALTEKVKKASPYIVIIKVY